MNARILAGIVVCLHSISTNAATISECQNLLRTGQYVECLDATTEAVNRRSYGEDWPLLKAEAEIQLGRYPEATETVEEAFQSWKASSTELAEITKAAPMDTLPPVNWLWTRETLL